MLPEGLRDEFGVLHRLDRLVEARGQRGHSECSSLPGCQSPDIILAAGWQFVALLDSLQSRGQDDREGQVGIAGAIQGTEFDPRRVALARLVHRDAHES